MGLKNPANFPFNNRTRKRRVEATRSFVPWKVAGPLIAQRVETTDGAEGLGHRMRAVFLHQRTRVLLFLRVFGLRFGLMSAPAAIAVITAIVCIPAQHIPKLWP